MYRQLIISSVLINFVVANEQNLSKHGSENNKVVVGAENRSNTTPRNITYIDKAENMIRLPAMNKYFEEKKSKRKSMKKSPRRTIQKIIKKNKSKIKKLYIIKMTSYPTIMPKVEFENAAEDFSPRKEETTTQSSQKKRSRKWNSKLPRYPMPFHQMQTRKNYKRDKRDTRDLFILKDLDNIEFLQQKKDYNVVNAHFKKYW